MTAVQIICDLIDVSGIIEVLKLVLKMAKAIVIFLGTERYLDDIHISVE